MMCGSVVRGISSSAAEAKALLWRKRMIGMVHVAGLITALTITGAGAQDKPPPSKLWAGVSASSPNSTSNVVFTVREAERLMIGFAVVNDGTEPVPFERGDTEFVINGKALAGFGESFREGPGWPRLEPGKSFSAALGLGKEFSKPGVYKVQWLGKGFKSAVLEFRVVGE
jgi:hypothetical protein